jgi:hypothetical protein
MQQSYQKCDRLGKASATAEPLGRGLWRQHCNHYKSALGNRPNTVDRTKKSRDQWSQSTNQRVATRCRSTCASNTSTRVNNASKSNVSVCPAQCVGAELRLSCARVQSKSSRCQACHVPRGLELMSSKSHLAAQYLRRFRNLMPARIASLRILTPSIAAALWPARAKWEHLCHCSNAISPQKPVLRQLCQCASRRCHTSARSIAHVCKTVHAVLAASVTVLRLCYHPVMGANISFASL